MRSFASAAEAKRAAALWAAVACAAPALARAELRLVLAPELRLGAGYDDNLFLDASPAGVPASQVRGDAIIDVAPRLGVRLEPGRHTLALDVDYLERITPSTGNLRDLGVRLGYATPPLGPVTLWLAGVYEHYEADFYPEDTFDLGGGEGGVRVQAGVRARLEASYRVAARHYPADVRAGQLDTEQRAGALARVRATSWLTVEGAYGYVHTASTSPPAAFDRHRGEVALEARPTRWLLVAARYGLAWQHLPSGPRDDLIHSGEAIFAARPIGWLEIYARYDLLWSTSSDPTGAYRRNQVLGGITLRYDWSRRWERPPLERPNVQGARVTFRHHAAGVHSVGVAGDWNGWQAQPLAPVSGGWYEGAYVVPCGRRRYSLVVDGGMVEPRDAASYVPDGFGGRNGVIDVECIPAPSGS